MKHISPQLIISTIILMIMSLSAKSQSLKALIIDGQNNHGAWPKNTSMMKDYLEQTGLFKVVVERTAITWQGPHSVAGNGDEPLDGLIESYKIESKKVTNPVDEPISDPNFLPDFSKYDVVISNFGWRAADWPSQTKQGLEEFVKKGGGLVVIHAANNSFGDWPEYNKMIGIGGWGDRNEKDGPFLYYDEKGKLVRDLSPGYAGSHGPIMDFTITMRDASHPITKGLPEKWMHVKDELYDRLRGPAQNVNVLATAYSDITENSPPWNEEPGTGRNEPMLMTIDYGRGRVFHSTLGHNDKSLECVGFIVTFQRGVEWAATGKVTQTIPDDFPGANKASIREWKRSQ